MEVNNYTTSKKIIEILLILLPVALLFSNIISEFILFAINPILFNCFKI